ncbi:VQ motif-containing protein 20-like [Humulus lupulus]|uniref:VQ motif-containing protein 20-like n=1 Tax=Humulus lupulus TaxID=3486 RepID=UPI002B407A44|nr:VQ motif-containing protein 20-like [Humulus lupulus]
MSPVNFINDQDHHHHHITINGPRPSPLKINRDSHSIQKSAHNFPGKVHHHQQQHQQQKRQPVIIYTHSPKIIHTQPRDFMALVQKLTGQSRSDNDEENDEDVRDDQSFGSKRRGDSSSNDVKLEDNESGASYSSGVSTDENYVSGVGSRDQDSAAVNGVVSSTSSAPYFGDVPLFTPTGAGDFFCSPRPVYRFSDTTSLSLSSPNLGSSLNSPSFLEFIKGLPEY